MATSSEKTPLLTLSRESTYDSNSPCVTLIDDAITDGPRQSDAEAEPGTAVFVVPESSDAVTEGSQGSSSAGSSEAAGEAQEPEGKMHDVLAVMSAIKGNMGTGILAMPYAVSRAGIVVGPALILIMGCIALACMHLLVRARHIQLQRAQAEGQRVKEMDYADLLACSMRTFRPCFRGRPEKWARRFVNGLLLISQLGFCSVYIVFISDNISEAVHTKTGTSLPIWQYQLCVAAALMVYSQVRGLTKSAPFQIIANVLTVFGLTIIFINFFSGELPDVSTRPYFAGWAFMPLFYGTAVFSYEGISLTLPLEAKVKDKRLYSALCGVVTLSLTIVICLYVAMGFFGFLVYGTFTRGSVTLNLPESPWYNFAVKPIFAVVIFLSYQLQLHVPVALVVDWLKDRNDWHGTDPVRVAKRHMAEAVVRVCFFAITLGIAMWVPKLDLLISLVGAFASSFLALFLPALIYLLTVLSPAHPYRPHPALIASLVLVMLMALLGWGSGTSASIIEMICGPR